MTEHNILGYQLDDLTLRFLLIGLAVVAALLALLTALIVCCCWRRRRRASKRVHALQQPHNITVEEAFGSPAEAGKTKSTPPPIIAITNHSSKPFSHHSPLPNGADYLDMDNGKRAPNNNGAKVLFADEVKAEVDDGKKNGVKRKDTAHPMHTITMMSGGNMGEAQRWALKDRPFTIIINNEIDEEEEEEEEHEMTKPENTTENRGPSTPPNSPNRFAVTKMERLAEGDERIHDEFESLNPSSMSTLGPRTTSAETSENIRKNRFFDVLPYEFNRVKLRWTSAYGGTDNAKTDYINASYIRADDNGPVLHIAAQGPIGEEEADGGRRLTTVRDFWEMVWQEDTDCIVMLSQCIEGKKYTSAEYWPCSPGESEQLSEEYSVLLYCVTEDDVSVQRELWLERKGHPRRTVLQWQFKDWHDSARPEKLDTLMEFMKTVRASAKRRPMIVHCSAGIGRTGVFIALDMLLDKLAKDQIIDIKQTVARLNAQRASMVQNADQYVAIYEAIAGAIRKKSRSYG